MKQIIVIKTTPDRYDWLNNCLQSLKGYDKYPIFVYSSFDYWLPSIFDFIDADEIAYFHDSVEFTDTSLFDELFNKYKRRSVMFFGNYKEHGSNYVPFATGMGKFKTSVLKQVKVPFMKTYVEESALEQRFGGDYLQLDTDDAVLLFPRLLDEPNAPIVELLGRQNKKTVTPYFIKYQGHWTEEHITAEGDVR